MEKKALVSTVLNFQMVSISYEFENQITLTDFMK